mgnify:CR=1 FL=1
MIGQDIRNPPLIAPRVPGTLAVLHHGRVVVRVHGKVAQHAGTPIGVLQQHFREQDVQVGLALGDRVFQLKLGSRQGGTDVVLRPRGLLI